MSFSINSLLVREGKGWYDFGCMNVPAAGGSSSLSPCCSLQAWHVRGTSGSLNYASIHPVKDAKCRTHLWLLSHAALQPAWSLQHFRGSAVPVHSKLLVVNTQHPWGPTLGISVSFSTTDEIFLLHEKWEVVGSENLNGSFCGNHHCLENQPGVSTAALGADLVWETATATGGTGGVTLALNLVFSFPT